MEKCAKNNTFSGGGLPIRVTRFCGIHTCISMSNILYIGTKGSVVRNEQTETS